LESTLHIKMTNGTKKLPLHELDDGGRRHVALHSSRTLYLSVFYGKSLKLLNVKPGISIKENIPYTELEFHKSMGLKSASSSNKG
jgi:hypothetical protein